MKPLINPMTQLSPLALQALKALVENETDSEWNSSWPQVVQHSCEDLGINFFGDEEEGVDPKEVASELLNFVQSL